MMLPPEPRSPALKFECPHCGTYTASRVLETRGPRRRRECLECLATYPTIETVVGRRHELHHRRPEPMLPFIEAEIVD